MEFESVFYKLVRTLHGGYKRRQKVTDKSRDNCRKRCTDDDGDGQIDYVTAENELFEFLIHTIYMTSFNIGIVSKLPCMTTPKFEINVSRLVKRYK